jgi:glutamate synthase (ferredoxin)
MSGGVAYVLDKADDFRTRCNMGMVELEELDANDIGEVKAMVERHVKYTGSELGSNVLVNWDEMAPKFVKVMPRDYKKMIQAIKKAQESGRTGEDALLAAFESVCR